jgi:hypothetical protein
MNPAYFERALVHEAGHAAVALALGIRVRRVRVEDEEVMTTTAHRREHGPPFDARETERRVAVEYAGYIAERRRFPFDREWARSGAETDFGNAEALVLSSLGDVSCSRCFRTSHRTVVERWNLIEAIAQLLRERGELLESEVVHAASVHGIDPRSIDGYEDLPEAA